MTYEPFSGFSESSPVLRTGKRMKSTVGAEYSEYVPGFRIFFLLIRIKPVKLRFATSSSV